MQRAVRTTADGASTQPRFYRLGSILAFYLSIPLTFEILAALHKSILGKENFKKYWVYDAPISLVPIVSFVLLERPELLRLSRWRPKYADVAVGIALGALVPSLILFCTGNPPVDLGLPQATTPPIVVAVCLAPILEEITFRGIFLRSLVGRMQRVVAILLVTILAAAGHSHFWTALLGQLVLSIVYVKLGYSIPGSIITHVTMNVVPLLPLANLLREWHSRIFWS